LLERVQAEIATKERELTDLLAEFRAATAETDKQFYRDMCNAVRADLALLREREKGWDAMLKEYMKKELDLGSTAAYVPGVLLRHHAFEWSSRRSDGMF